VENQENQEEMVTKNDGGEKNALISGKYYLAYTRMLRLVIPIAAAGVAFASILALCFEWQPDPDPFRLIGQAFGRIVGGVISGSIQAFAFVTIIFAILEYKKVDLKGNDLLSHLPPAPKESSRIKPQEPVFSIMFSVLATVIFLGFPQIFTAWLDGALIPIFDEQAVRGLWLPIILWAVLGISKEVVKLIDGRYTIRLAVVTLAANMLILLCAAPVFLNGSIFNPAIADYVKDLIIAKDIEVLAWPLENTGLIFFGMVSFALILEAAVTAAKAWRYNKREAIIDGNEQQ